MDDNDKKSDQKIPEKELIYPLRMIPKMIPKGMIEEQRENARKQGLICPIIYFGDDAIEDYNKRHATKEITDTSASLGDQQNLSMDEQKSCEDIEVSYPHEPTSEDETESLCISQQQYPQPPYFPQQTYECVPIEERHYVGLRRKDALDINAYEEKAKIDVLAYKSKQVIKSQLSKTQTVGNGYADLSVINSDNDNKNDNLNFVDDFIKLKKLVKIDTKATIGDYTIYKWDEKTYRYQSVDQIQLLETEFTEFLYRTYEDIKISDSEVKKFVKQMRFLHIPLLEDSNLEVSQNDWVFFQNGYYSLKTGDFYFIDTSRFFHTFSLPYNFQDTVGNPRTFNLMLSQIFDNDETKITLTYQIIGAILSDMCNLKYIFVFQGISHSGKSTLANCIRHLLRKDEALAIGGINDLSESKVNKSEKKRKLLYIKDASSSPIQRDSVSYLKSCSDGIIDDEAVTFKILINTNHSIYTERKGELEEALSNRLIVLPFNKDMTKEKYNESIYNLIESNFKDERQQIVQNSLNEFHKIVATRDSFAKFYPINECVITGNVTDKTERTESNVGNDVSTDKLVNTGKTSTQNPALVKILSTDFEVTADKTEFLQAETVLYYLKGKLNVEGRVNDLGKVVKSVFGDEIDDRINNKTYYKIKLKS